MRLNLSSVVDYTAWIFKKYQEIQQSQENNIHRIVDIKEFSSGGAKIIVQVVGKSSVIECSAQEIVADDQMIEGFSRKDIRTITFYACQQIKKPKYKIIMQEFCDKFNQIIFKLKEDGRQDQIVKTANQIMLDNSIVDNLSKSDANSISYIAGYECSLNDGLSSKRSA